jgi:hypothetical protein
VAVLIGLGVATPIGEIAPVSGDAMPVPDTIDDTGASDIDSARSPSSPTLRRGARLSSRLRAGTGRGVLFLFDQGPPHDQKETARRSSR